MKKILLFSLVLCALAITGCSSGGTQIVEVPVEVPVEVTRIVEVPVEVTRIVEVEVAASPPEAAPTDTAPIAEGSAIFLELEGAGSLVSDNFLWPACDKAVFSSDKPGGDHTMRVILINVDTNDEINLLSMYTADTHAEALQPLLGGTYYIFVDRGPNSGWTIMGECKD